MTKKNKKFTSVVLYADTPTKNGTIYTQEALRKMADGDSRLSFKEDKLWYTGEFNIVLNGVRNKWETIDGVRVIEDVDLVSFDVITGCGTHPYDEVRQGCNGESEPKPQA